MSDSISPLGENIAKVPDFYGFEDPALLPPNLSKNSHNLIAAETDDLVIDAAKALRGLQALLMTAAVPPFLGVEQQKYDKEIQTTGHVTAHGFKELFYNHEVMGSFVNWKAVVFGLGAYALVNTATKVGPLIKYSRDFSKTHIYKEKAGELELLQTSVKEPKSGVARKIGMKAMAFSALAAGYIAGEHVGIGEAALTDLGGTAAAAVLSIVGIRIARKQHKWLWGGKS